MNKQEKKPISSSRKKKLERNKNIILDVAEKFFTEKSYDDVKVDNIAEESAISKATIYTYFHSKEGLYYSIGIRAYKFINAQMNLLLTTSDKGLDIISGLIIANMEGREEFKLYNEITIRFIQMDPQIHTEIIRKLSTQMTQKDNDNRLFKILMEYLRGIRLFTSKWKEAVERGQKDGSISNIMNIDLITQYIFILINGIVQLRSTSSLFFDEGKLHDSETVQNLTLSIVQSFLHKSNLQTNKANSKKQ